MALKVVTLFYISTGSMCGFQLYIFTNSFDDSCPSGCGMISHSLTINVPEDGYLSLSSQHSEGCTHASVSACMLCAYVPEHQRSIPGAFLYCFPPYFLRQGLSLIG